MRSTLDKGVARAAASHVDFRTAIHEIDGQAMYFCCEHCRARKAKNKDSEVPPDVAAARGRRRLPGRRAYISIRSAAWK